MAFNLFILNCTKNAINICSWGKPLSFCVNLNNLPYNNLKLQIGNLMKKDIDILSLVRLQMPFTSGPYVESTPRSLLWLATKSNELNLPRDLSRNNKLIQNAKTFIRLSLKTQSQSAGIIKKIRFGYEKRICARYLYFIPWISKFSRFISDFGLENNGKK